MRKTALLLLFVCLTLSWIVSAQADQYGYVYCESKPKGAVIYFDTLVASGTEAPFMRSLTVGAHSAVISLPGYVDKKLSFSISPNEVTRLVVDFTQNEKTPSTTDVLGPVEWNVGRLTILTDRQATIYLDGQKLTTPAPVTLDKIEMGKHRIALEHENERFANDITIKGGEVNRVEALFDPNALDRGIVWPRPTVLVHLTLHLPKCDYRVRRENAIPTDRSSFHGVDNEVRISGLNDSGVTIAARSFVRPAEFRERELSGIVAGGDTVVMQALEVPLDSAVQFAFSIYPNPKGTFKTRKDVARIMKRHRIPADLNDGEELHVEAVIQPDGDLLFRYW